MDDKQTCDLCIDIGGMAFAFFLFFLFLEGGGGWEKGVQPSFILHSQLQTKKKNVNYDTKEIVHEHSSSLSTWKKFFYFYFFS